MAFIPKPHEIYKHFKGNLYQITAVAEHTETGEKLVVYQALYGDFKTYARPLSMFTERLSREKYPHAEQEFRFELQGSDKDRQMRETEPALETGKGSFGEGGQKPENAQGILLKAGHSSDSVVPSEGKASFEKAVSSEKEVFSEKATPSEKELSSDEEASLDPLLLEFLDADTYEERLNILAGLHHRITDEMITTMSIACDVEVENGDVEERYEALKACLLTLERYECNRMR